jgi:predicted phosphodiesterase
MGGTSDPYPETKMARTLIIGDTHLPFTHRHYFDFCRRIRSKYRCDTVVHIGDEVDNHAISYHETNPDGWSAGHEADRAEVQLQKWWFKSFPNAHVCLGNHSHLHMRQAMTAGIPKRFMKTHSEAWNAPKGWKWADAHEIDGVLYIHGIGFSGETGHLKAAKEHRQSIVMGHANAFAGVAPSASRHDLIFGMNVGCGIDIDAYAFAFGKHFPKRPILSCGVVIDGHHAIWEPMIFKNKRLRRPMVAVPRR